MIARIYSAGTPFYFAGIPVPIRLCIWERGKNRCIFSSCSKGIALNEQNQPEME